MPIFLECHGDGGRGANVLKVLRMDFCIFRALKGKGEYIKGGTAN